MQAAGLVLTSYQDSLSRAMDVVANNVANSNTTGFKREDIKFDTFISQPTMKDKINFAVDRGTFRNTAPGPSVVTGNPLDFSIQGEGYFPIRTQEGIRYTRSGAFQLNNQGEIVTANGDQLLGDGDQPITVPQEAESIAVGSDGIVSVKTGANASMSQLGKLKLVKFEREQDLQSLGNGLYDASTQTPQADIESRVTQGMLERSNVQAVSEITRMVEVLRTYQQVTRLLDLDNQRQSNAINRLSKVTA